MERESEKDSNPRSGFRGKDESLFNFEGVKTFKRSGGVAQLGEHLLCKQGVIGSIPFISTTSERKREQVGETHRDNNMGS